MRGVFDLVTLCLSLIGFGLILGPFLVQILTGGQETRHHLVKGLFQGLFGFLVSFLWFYFLAIDQPRDLGSSLVVGVLCGLMTFYYGYWHSRNYVKREEVLE